MVSFQAIVQEPVVDKVEDRRFGLGDFRTLKIFDSPPCYILANVLRFCSSRVR